MSEERRERRFVRIAKLVALTVTPVLLLIIIAETIATISITRRSRITVDPATGRSMYTMSIGKWPWSRSTMTPINSLGYPDDEFPRARRKSSCLHILFSGDSYVFGDGVDRDSSFVEIVRRQTAARAGGRCLRMFNIGVRGTTIDRQTTAIMKVVDQLQPDVVIIGQYQNDLTDLNGPGAILDPNRDRNLGRPGGDSIRVHLKVFNANLIKMLTYRMFAFMIRNDYAWDVLRHWSVMADTARQAEARRFQGAYAGLYAELVSTLRVRGIDFGVIIIPSKLDVMAKQYPEETFFLELARTHAVPSLRLFPAFDAHRSPYAYLMYDGHLNERGNSLVASGLYRWLFVEEPAPFPALRQQMVK